MISKKKKKIEARIEHASQPLFTSLKVINTTLPAKPLFHGPKPHFPRFTPRLEERRIPTPDRRTCPPKARRPLATLPSLPLRVLASSYISQRRALQPQLAQPPPPSANAATLSLPPSLPHWERLGKDPRGYWSARLHESKLSTQNTGPLSLSLEVTSYLDEMAKDFTRM